MSQLERRESGLLVPAASFAAKGVYHWKHIRDGKVIDEGEDENKIVNEGLNYLLNVALQGATPLTTWYLGIFQGNYTPVATDTAAVIASNSTENTGYSGGVRLTWTPVASTSQSITNAASPATFTFSGSYTIYGAFLVSSNVRNGTGGTLMSAAQFGTSKSVVSSDQLVLTYTLTDSSST